MMNMLIGLTFDDIQRLRKTSLQQGIIKKLEFIESIQYSKVGELFGLQRKYTRKFLEIRPKTLFETGEKWRNNYILKKMKRFLEGCFHSSWYIDICYTTLEKLKEDLKEKPVDLEGVGAILGEVTESLTAIDKKVSLIDVKNEKKSTKETDQISTMTD